MTKKIILEELNGKRGFTGSLTAEFLEKKFPHFDIKQVTEKIEAALPQNNTNKLLLLVPHNCPDYLLIRAISYDNKNKPALNVDASIKFKNKTLHISGMHNYENAGTGSARMLVHGLITSFLPFPVSMIRAQAKGIGSYYWARCGLTPYSDLDWKDLTDAIQPRFYKLAGLISDESADKIREAINSHDPQSIRIIANLEEEITPPPGFTVFDGVKTKLGKILLTQITWDAKLDPADRQSMEIFNEYTLYSPRTAVTAETIEATRHLYQQMK